MGTSTTNGSFSIAMLNLPEGNWRYCGVKNALWPILMTCACDTYLYRWAMCMKYCACTQTCALTWNLYDVLHSLFVLVASSLYKLFFFWMGHTSCGEWDNHALVVSTCLCWSVWKVVTRLLFSSHVFFPFWIGFSCSHCCLRQCLSFLMSFRVSFTIPNPG